MKTSAELQRISFIRKLTYFGLILVLFTVMTFYGRVFEKLRDSTRTGMGQPTWLSRQAERLAALSVSRQARQLQLNESDQGQADLAGSTARLSLSGARGFVICFLWIQAIDNQKRHEWNEVEMLTNTITKLQPHFLTPWLFQSWNLAYNVSVEADRVRDKYFYISKGITLLCDGERINRYRGIDANGDPYIVGNPDMRFWIGFYYTNKFGSSDEQQTLRSLFQMSCINPAKRDANLLRPDGHTVDLAAFQEFVAENPMLCRRLRDYLRCNRPEDVVDFLSDNSKIPLRYEIVDNKWTLKRRAEDQWPVLPDSPQTRDDAPPNAEVGGDFESYRAAWAWHHFAQEPLPPVDPGKPAAGVPEYDHLRYRMARAPASIIFRQQPARALSYVAERFMKEGWFDSTGWVVDEGRLTDHWFDKKVVVGAGPRYSSQEAWNKAHQAWEAHGRLNGFLLTEADKRNLEEDAQVFRSTYDLKPYELGPTLIKDEVSPELWKSYDAQRQLVYLQQNETMTNFKHHLYRAEAEKDDRTIKARKLLFEASRSRGNPEIAIPKYEEGFRELVGDPASGRQGLLDAYPDFRHDTTMQEEWLEKEYRYLQVLDQFRSPTMRKIVTIPNLLAQSLVHPAIGSYGALLYQYSPRHQELPLLFRGPLDGNDSKDQPWVDPSAVSQVKSRIGLVRRTPTQRPTGVANPNGDSSK
jgi:hypothetical protein